MQILVIKETSLGDVLHITPFLRAVKKKYPGADIDVLVDKRAVDILAHNPNIRTLHIVDVYRWERDAFSSPAGLIRTLKDIARSIRAVRRIRYDAVFDLQGLARSALFLYAARAKAKFAKGRWIGVPHLYYRDIHAIDGLLQFLDFIDVPSDGQGMDFALPRDIHTRVKRTLAAQKVRLPAKYIIYAPYSRWQTKDMPLEKSKEIITALIERYHIPVIICATGEYADACASLAGRNKRIIPLAGILSIAELGAVISRAKGMVSVDSFPMHAASAFTIPLIAIFGPTSEKRIGPLSSRSEVVRAAGIDCARCYKRHCPFGHECMRSIDAALVAAALARTMRQKRSP